jgi:hypothetical protein
MTPAPTFKEAVCRRDLTEDDAAWQIAARINHAAPKLAHIQRLSARVLTSR